jgi:predicted acylesterase/phospholipase RssA
MLLLAGCIARPTESVETRTLLPMEAVDPEAGAAATLNAGRIDEDGVHTVLALSAGGADGAYGAGVLNGWSKSGTRPQFDVVTGVSTGALMAVLAFLGADQDPLLEKFYTTQTNDKIFRKVASAASFYDNGPLKEQIEEFVTDEVLARVAAEHAKGRRLYIATTNLDAGDLVIWDMGKIATGGRSDNRLHFQKVLRASAAVPGYFAPVYIKPQRGVQLRQAHVDGGVKAPVLVSGFMFPPGKGKKELYLIVNGNTTRQNAVKPVDGTLADIAKKSIAELMRGLQAETVYKDYALARNVGAHFRMTSIPDSIEPAQESLNFDNARMRKLYAAGFEDGLKSPKQWLTAPPNTEKAAQLAAN